MEKIKLTPQEIAREYADGTSFKDGIGERGLQEQSKINERFFIGDQWYGVHCGNSKPLARRNLIKRIGEYKMSVIGSAPIAVNYSADGVADTEELQNEKRTLLSEIKGGKILSGAVDPAEISIMMTAISDYFNVTAERVKLDIKKEQLLRNAYISGTALCYTYWDPDIKTGLYADAQQTIPLDGDIALEVLDVENVVFGDPNTEDIQQQPYIIMAKRCELAEVRREARRNRLDEEEILAESTDRLNVNIGDRGEREPSESKRVTVFTKLYKEYDRDGRNYRMMAVRVTENAVVRKPWCIGISCYPIAAFTWERRHSSAYGESEITYMIPNQIAVNRMLTAGIWAAMVSNMPIMVVNGDTVTADITNEPGQIIKVYGSNEDVVGAVRYVTPPQFQTGYFGSVDAIFNQTLSDNGANDAALGNLRPDNATALIALREAALAPMQLYQNRFFGFIEELARIWADFWIHLYGRRPLKVRDKSGLWYIDFQAERYQRLLINARVDVGASTVWSEAVVIQTLDNLLRSGIITVDQYLERLPSGMIPDVTGLRNDLHRQETVTEEPDITDGEILENLRENYPNEYEIFRRLSENERRSFLLNLQSGAKFSSEEEGDL
ncbi:MAG: hypothetical protein IKI29_01955 [Clostridia bacterium]|nr:hypothetical protein [Clostridia bacterium]